MSSNLLSAKDLVRQSRRPDIFLKFKYAECFLKLGYVPDSIKEMYLQSIESFNSFNEFLPRKIGPQDFLKHFDDLIESIKTRGFVPNQDDEVISVNNEMEIIGGAHRVSILAALNMYIPKIQVQNNHNVFDFEYFEKRKMNEEALRYSLLVKAYLGADLSCLIVHSKVSTEIYQQIEHLIENRTRIIHSLNMKLELDQTLFIKFINYRDSNEHESWIGTLKSKYAPIYDHARKSYGKFPVRIILIPKLSDSSIRDLKEEIRALPEVGNFGIHSTESAEETRQILELFCHPTTSLMFREKYINCDIEFIAEAQDISSQLSHENLVNKDRFVVGGSYTLEVFRLRRARDLDVFTDVTPLREDSIKSKSGRIIECHDLSKEHPLDSIDDILLDPKNHLYLFNIPIISLMKLKKWKLTRNEKPKDLQDIELIDALLSSSGDYHRNQSRYTNHIKWKLRAFFTRARIATFRFLYSYSVTRIIGKKILSILRGL